MFPRNEGEGKSGSSPRGSEVPLCRLLASPMRHSPPNLGKHRDDWLEVSEDRHHNYQEWLGKSLIQVKKEK